MRWFLFLLTGYACLAADPVVRFDARESRWTLNNGQVEAAVRILPDSTFVLERLTDLRSGDAWAAPEDRPSPLFRVRVDGTWIGGQSPVELVGYSTGPLRPSGTRLDISLNDLRGLGRIDVGLELYADQPVLRYEAAFTSLSPETVRVNRVNMAPWAFADQGRGYTAFRVNQWVTDTRPGDFQPLQTALSLEGKPVEVYSGAHGQHCGWLALRDSEQRGLFAGWEFDGRMKTTVRQYGDGAYLQFASNIPDLNHPLALNETFHVPPVFVGLFHGDWDEAGYRTQRFAEAVLAAPAPRHFPYVGWDSWGYQADITEEVLRQNARIAAAMGMELFTVDLGWARAIGDWHADPVRFPSGLRALSGYVHSLGMKFGLHFALAEAAESSPVLRQHPDWTTSVAYHYFGAESLCLSNRPTREWLIEEAVRLIDDCGVDWILQDGENMVKECTKTTHTHDPADSNYANAVEGLNAAIAEIQRLRPEVYWENCENGGNMMTFNMVRRYVTSITNDASGSLAARRAVYGATYPFPPRYADRYMPEQKLDPYTTNSYLFGGPWLMMNRLTDMTQDELEYLAREVKRFKEMRGVIANGKVFHLTAIPTESRIDAIQSYDEGTDSGVAVVTRPDAPQQGYQLRPRGLRPEGSYEINFEESPRTLLMSGEQLMRDGVRVSLATPRSSDVVHIRPRVTEPAALQDAAACGRPGSGPCRR